jgi:penicillin-binding protein 2
MDIENNAWLVTFAPQENPQIVVVVYVQNGYSGALAASAAIAVTEAYLDAQGQSASLATIDENTLAD